MPVMGGTPPSAIGRSVAQATGGALPHSFFEDGANAPITWNRLVENMRLAVERYRQAITNSDRSEYVKRADDISDHLRLLLAAGSGTTDNHSGQPSIILTNKPLYPHFRDMMSKFSKLVLSSHIAATDWPTPESYAKCLHEAEGVLQGVYGYVEVARQQRGEDIPRLVPGFVVGAVAGANWQNNGLAGSSSSASTYFDRDEYDSVVEPAIRLDSTVLGRLEDLKRMVVASLRRLDEQLTIKEKIVTAQRHEVLGDAVCTAGTKVMEFLKVWLSIVESINLASLGSTSRNPQLVDFFAQKQRLYDLVADLVLGCQAVTAPLGDEWAELRGDPLEERLRHVAETTERLESSIGQVYGSLQYLDEMMAREHHVAVMNSYMVGGHDPYSCSTASCVDWPDLKEGALSDEDRIYLANGRLESDSRSHRVNTRKLENVLGPEVLVPPPLAPAPEETPDFLRLDLENELVFDEKADPPQIRGGTLAALVEQLTRHDKLDSDFNNTFLLTYRSFTSALELFDLLVMRFSIQPPYGLAQQHYQMWADVKQMPIRLRVVNILKSWFGNYWMEKHDAASKDLIRKAYDFAEKSITTSSTPGAQALMAVLDQRLRGQDASPKELVRNQNTPVPPPILPKNLKKLKFLDIDALEFARQLTIIDSNLYGKIKSTEWLNKMWQKSASAEDPEPAVNVRAVILHSNQLTSWVAEMILTQTEVKRRSLVIKHFIAIAEVRLFPTRIFNLAIC